MMHPRKHHLARVRLLLDEFPIVALLGARQIGKTTLARQLAGAHRDPVAWFDLEDTAVLARLQNPGLELRHLRGLVVLDEIHRLPDIFKLLRVLVERPGPPARFLVLGSASAGLLRQTSESLAGRLGVHVLDGFDLTEANDRERLWLRGCFPRAYLASSDVDSLRWRDRLIRTLLERDLPDLGNTVPSTTLHRFCTMLARRHGRLWNGAEFARAFGASHTTVGRYLDLLTSVFVVRRLPPWIENISKRQVRSQKIYIADSGILHALLGLADRTAVLSHPQAGASWEGFVIQQIARLMRAPAEKCFHWSTYTGAKLDLLVLDGSRRFGFEVGRSEAPGLTRSMLSAVETLGLDRLYVVHSGTKWYRLADRIFALPTEELVEELRGRPANPLP